MKRVALGFIRVADYCADGAAFAAALCLASIVLLLSAEIIVRTILGATLGDVWEYATYFMSLIFFLGAAYTLRAGVHVRVSLLRFSNARIARAAEFIASAVGLVLSIFMAVALTDLAWQSYVRGVVSATPSATPLYLPRFGIALGAWLLTLQIVARMVAILIAVSVERPVEDHDGDPRASA